MRGWPHVIDPLECETLITISSVNVDVFPYFRLAQAKY